MALPQAARSKPRTTYQLPLLLCVTPRRGTPRREDHSSLTILLVGKSPASPSLLVGWSPHRDLPSSLFPSSSFVTPQVRHSLLASLVSHLRRNTHKRCGSTYSTVPAWYCTWYRTEYLLTRSTLYEYLGTVQYSTSRTLKYSYSIW